MRSLGERGSATAKYDSSTVEMKIICDRLFGADPQNPTHKKHLGKVPANAQTHHLRLR